MHFRQSRGAALRALPAIAAAAPFAVFALRILIHHRDPDLSGDSALLDMATRSAAHFHREVGPYSRYGFSHPGPALFYAAAPVLLATSDAPWALMLTVQVISGLAAVGAVLVVQQRRGVGAGAVTAGVVLIYAVAVDLGLLQMAWNPLVIMLPVALCLVAAAAAVDRPAGALAVTFLAGTFAVQTHVGTTPVVAGAAAVAIAGAAFGWRRFERGRALIGPAVIAGVGVLAWVPPLLEQITHNPGNLGSLLRFFRSGTSEATPGFEHQVAFAGRQLAVVPFGLVYKGSLSPATVSLGRGVAAFVVFLAAAAVLIVFGWRRRHSLARQLGIVSAAGAISAAYAVSGIRGEVYWYLTTWMSAVVVPLLLGWLLLWRWTPRAATAFVVVIGLTASVIAANKPLYNNRAFPVDYRYRREFRAVWSDVAPLLAHRPRSGSLLLSGDSEAFAARNGVADQAAREGWPVHVSPNWVPFFGREFASDGHETVSIFIARVSPPPTGAVLLGDGHGSGTRSYLLPPPG